MPRKAIGGRDAEKQRGREAERWRSREVEK